MGTPLGPKYIPYTYMDPLGSREARNPTANLGFVLWVFGEGIGEFLKKGGTLGTPRDI